jgi:hypothetical protein
MRRRRATPRVAVGSGSKRAPNPHLIDSETGDFPVDDLPPDDFPARDIYEDQEKLHLAQNVVGSGVSRPFPGQVSSISDPSTNTPEFVWDLTASTQPEASAVLGSASGFEILALDAESGPETAEAQIQYVLPGLEPEETERLRKQAARPRRSRGPREKGGIGAAQIELWPEEER